MWGRTRGSCLRSRRSGRNVSSARTRARRCCCCPAGTCVYARTAPRSSCSTQSSNATARSAAGASCRPSTSTSEAAIAALPFASSAARDRSSAAWGRGQLPATPPISPQEMEWTLICCPAQRVLVLLRAVSAALHQTLRTRGGLCLSHPDTSFIVPHQGFSFCFRGVGDQQGPSCWIPTFFPASTAQHITVSECLDNSWA